jgi:hypothetical protein
MDEVMDEVQDFLARHATDMRDEVIAEQHRRMAELQRASGATLEEHMRRHRDRMIGMTLIASM